MPSCLALTLFEREAFQRMQNIIVLEAKIKAYAEVKEKFKDFLNELTENLVPSDLVNELREGKKKTHSKDTKFSPWNENDNYLN